MSERPDPFPPSDFDDWAGEYDQDVGCDRFPFNGYHRALAEVVRLAATRQGQKEMR